MAITQDYVDYATGNDYKGATFTDGAYTSATKTLVKAGAFAATKVNHWLYLETDGTGSITPGYYRVETWTDANTVILATDAGGGVDDDAAKCTQHDGSTAKPWRSVQGALDLCTRNATGGNQVNVKSGAAQVNSAGLVTTTFIAGAALAAAAPLVIRGYTAAANDGGIGEIDAGGYGLFDTINQTDIHLRSLEMHSFGNNQGVYIGSRTSVIDCEVHKGASTPVGRGLIFSAKTVLRCYVHDAGTNGIGCYGIETVLGCYVANCPTGLSACSTAVSNTLSRCGTGIIAMAQNAYWGNAIWTDTASTGWGIGLNNDLASSAITNNIVVGYSGVGGRGVYGSGLVGMAGYNAFYNNSTPVSIVELITDLTANDVTLAADPFVDAANGDFSLTAAAKTALRGVGWPEAYLGAHANTDGHVTIGAIQYGEAPTGYPAVGDVKSGVVYGESSEYTGTLAAGGGGAVRIASAHGRTRM